MSSLFIGLVLFCWVDFRFIGRIVTCGFSCRCAVCLVVWGLIFAEVSGLSGGCVCCFVCWVNADGFYLWWCVIVLGSMF